MKLVGLEAKKLLLNKAVYIFTSACLIFNIILIVLTGGERDYIKYVGEVVNIAGDQVDASFMEYLEAQPENILRDRLIENCRGAEKIYDVFDTRTFFRNYYNEHYIETSFLVRLFYAKYEKLDGTVRLLNSANADLSVFAAEASNQVYSTLFTDVLKALLVEGIMIISLFTIFCFGIERQNLTDAVIYSSKKGRSLVKHKIVAAGVVSICFVLLLYIVTLTLFFTVWDFGGIWNTNVSSGFHYVTDLNLPYNKPFLTWAGFSVKKYFIASLFLEMAVLVVWWMVSSCISILSSHSAKGFMILAAFFILPYFLSHFFESLRLWWLFFINTFTISMLTLNQHLWFTEMGAFEILPWQEVLSVLTHLPVCSIILYIAIRIFRRKELS